MQYKIVQSKSLDSYSGIEFTEEKVRILCEQGWVPQGGVSITAVNGNGYTTEYIVAQAMVKEN